MATLAALKKQMAALEAKMAKATKAEMGGAIAKVRKLMADFGLTVEHLGGTASTGRAASKKSESVNTSAAAKKPKGGRPAKYQDPKSGATWSGFGRAPKWLAKVKNRDDFLVGKAAAAQQAAEPLAAATKSVSGKVAGAKKVARKVTMDPAASKQAGVKKSAAKKAAGKKVAPKNVVGKKDVAEKAAAKKVAAKKVAAKKSTSKKVATKTARKQAAAKPAVADTSAAQSSMNSPAS